MVNKNLNNFVILIIIFVVMVSSCSPKPMGPPEKEIEVTTTSTSVPTTIQNQPTSEPTLLPDNIVTASTPAAPQLNWPTQQITLDNVDEIREIYHWGRGSVTRILRLHENSDNYLVLTPLGLYYYQTLEPYLLTFIPDAEEFVLSHNERLLAVSMKNGNVDVWDIEDISVRETYTHEFPEDIIEKIESDELLPHYVGGMVFSPDDSQIAIGYIDGTIALQMLGEKDPYVVLHHPSFPMTETELTVSFQLQYSPDGKKLVVFKNPAYLTANRLAIWSLPDAELLHISDADRFVWFTDPSFLSDQQTFLVLSEDQSGLTVNLWDIQTGTRLGKFGTGLSDLLSLEVVSNEEQVIMYGLDFQQNYYRQERKLPGGNLIENEQLNEIPANDELRGFEDFLFKQGHYNTVWADKSGISIAKLGVIGNQEFRILEKSHWITFPAGVGELHDLPEIITEPVIDFQNQIVVWCEPKVINSLKKDGELTNMELPSVSKCDGLTISNQKNYAAVWYDRSLYLVNLQNGNINQLILERPYDSIIYTAVFTPDEKFLLRSGASLVVWQSEPLGKWANSNMGVGVGRNTEFVFSKDNTFAVALDANIDTESDRNSHLKIWRIDDAFAMRVISPPYINSVQPKFISFALSPDDTLIASGDDFGWIHLWNVENGDELAKIEFDYQPLKLAFTPDGNSLIAVLGDGTIRLLGLP